jgi:hypothetical protein
VQIRGRKSWTVIPTNYVHIWLLKCTQCAHLDDTCVHWCNNVHIMCKYEVTGSSGCLAPSFRPIMCTYTLCVHTWATCAHPVPISGQMCTFSKLLRCTMCTWSLAMCTWFTHTVHMYKFHLCLMCTSCAHFDCHIYQACAHNVHMQRVMYKRCAHGVRVEYSMCTSIEMCTWDCTTLWPIPPPAWTKLCTWVQLCAHYFAPVVSNIFVSMCTFIGQVQ